METETKKETAEYTDVESQINRQPRGRVPDPEGADIDVSVSETPDKKLHITETVTVDEHEYLECEKRWVFLLLMMVGGFFGGFTYSIRGGVFCNAQTANIVLLGPHSAGDSLRMQHIISSHKRVSARLIRVGAYRPADKAPAAHPLGHALYSPRDAHSRRACAHPGDCPVSDQSGDDKVFICSMQYNTFRQAQSVPMATTFCTNHVRQVGVAISKAIRHKDKSPYVSRMLLHLGMLGMFLAGVISSVLLAGVFLGKAMFFALIPLGIIAADLLHADLTTEKNILDRKPHGH